MQHLRLRTDRNGGLCVSSVGKDGLVEGEKQTMCIVLSSPQLRAVAGSVLSVLMSRAWRREAL